MIRASLALIAATAALRGRTVLRLHARVELQD
jgi:hypothetical protein